jgi:hypothetical protein
VIIAREERTVAFVTDQAFLSAENVSVAQASSFIHPMIGILYCEAGGIALACPPASGIAITNSSKRIFRVLFPRLKVTDEGRWVELVVSTLNEITKLDMPPARVAAEKSYIATLPNECFDMRAHLLAPVLVVTDAEQEMVWRKEVTFFVQVEVGTLIHSITAFFEPRDERNVPMCECLAR